jgi:hypothetical protein
VNALQSKRFRMVGVVAFRGRRFRGLRSLSPDYRWNRREEHGSQILFRLADLSCRSDRYSLLAHRSDSFREVGVGSAMQNYAELHGREWSRAVRSWGRRADTLDPVPATSLGYSPGMVSPRVDNYNKKLVRRGTLWNQRKRLAFDLWSDLSAAIAAGTMWVLGSPSRENKASKEWNRLRNDRKEDWH